LPPAAEPPNSGPPAHFSHPLWPGHPAAQPGLVSAVQEVAVSGRCGAGAGGQRRCFACGAGIGGAVAQHLTPCLPTGSREGRRQGAAVVAATCAQCPGRSKPTGQFWRPTGDEALLCLDLVAQRTPAPAVSAHPPRQRVQKPKCAEVPLVAYSLIQAP
jgi:hypothetical protein